MVGGKVKIRYSPISFSSEPQLTYEDADGVQVVRCSDIEQVQTGIGTLVTFSLSERCTVTLLMPIFNLSGNLSPFKTWAITTTHDRKVELEERGFEKIWRLPTGALLSYRVDELTGTAKRVLPAPKILRSSLAGWTPAGNPTWSDEGHAEEKATKIG
jgi:hypothetical protein